MGSLGSAADGRPRHGHANLLVETAAEIGFHWSSTEVGWVREGLPVLSNLAGPVILYELWAGERLDLEKAVPRCRRQVAQFQCRLFFLVQAWIFGGPAGSLGLCLGLSVRCQEVFIGFALWYGCQSLQG